MSGAGSSTWRNEPEREIRGEGDLERGAGEEPDLESTEADDDGEPEGPSADSEAIGGDDPQLELTLVRAERDEYLDALRRLQAEFENFRKRTERHQAELASRASEALIVRLLPVLDAFDLALDHAREKATDPELAQALAQIGALLGSALEREGLERIDETGSVFDPTVHDAVAHEQWEEADSAAGGVVVEEVMRAGYRLKGRVLRPAMVKVKG